MLASFILEFRPRNFFSTVKYTEKGEAYQYLIHQFSMLMKSNIN